MEMQDNEFDDLFRSKLDDFEMEPSPAVWPGVENELNAKKRKGVLITFLSVAASIIVLITAGMVFMPQKPVKDVKRIVKIKDTKVDSTWNNIVQTVNTSHADIIKHSIKQPIIGLKPTSKIATVAERKIKQTIQPENTTPIKNPDNLAKQDEKVVIASVIDKADVKPTVPGNEIKLSVQPVDDKTLMKVKPAMIAAQLPVEDIKTIAPAKQKHRIRSFGDLINVVVAKVEKNQGPLIKTDGESNITGINLGAINIRKDQKDN